MTAVRPGRASVLQLMAEGVAPQLLGGVALGQPVG
jgi:hypothetical protein